MTLSEAREIYFSHIEELAERMDIDALLEECSDLLARCKMNMGPVTKHMLKVQLQANLEKK